MKYRPMCNCVHVVTMYVVSCLLFTVQVLIKVLTVGVNPWETFAREGCFGIPPEQLPFTPGSDCAGIVVRVGANVSKLKVRHCLQSLIIFIKLC